jgi:tRNA dimethylallyltransferase
LSRKNKYLIVIGGPTASGKTRLAITLARHFHCSIVSADSRQFYRQMSIGTAKPNQEELAQAKHYFIDTLDIWEPYTVGDFEKDALKVLNNLYCDANIVVMVGGSGLYHRVVCEGLDFFPEIAESTIEQIELIYKAEGLSGLQNKLRELDPIQFRRSDVNNTQRVKRALSVCLATGKPYSSFLNQENKLRDFKTLYFCTDLPRDVLYERIDRRVASMIEDGLEQEARELIEYKTTNALQTVGYKEWFSYWNGEYPSVGYTIEKIKQHSRNYAKRQLTWFKNQGSYQFVHPEDSEEIIQKIEAII